MSPPKSSSTSFSSSPNECQPGTSQHSTNKHLANGSAETPLTSAVYTAEGHRSQESTARSPSPSHVRLSDVLKRKRVAKRAGASNRSKTRHEELPVSPSLMQDLFTKAAALGSSTTTPNNSSSRTRCSGSKTSFLQSLNPAR